VNPQQREVFPVEPKLRIMTIRLLSRMEEQPGYAAQLGISGATTKVHQNQSERGKRNT